MNEETNSKTIILSPGVKFETNPAQSEDDKPFECYDKIIYDNSDFTTIRPAPSYESMKEHMPPLANQLWERGFYLQGSRSKFYAGSDALIGADWDFTFPVLDHNNFKTENTEFVKSLGFILSCDDDDQSQMTGDSYITDLNFDQYWVHKEHPVTIMRRKNENLFRYVWDNIDPVTFEMHVWKRSFYNTGVPRWQVRDKRHNFMQSMYAMKIGLANFRQLM